MESIANFAIHGNKYDRYILGRIDIKIQIGEFHISN